MSRNTENAQSCTTCLRHSAVLGLPAVLLREVSNTVYGKLKGGIPLLWLYGNIYVLRDLDHFCRRL